MRVVPVHVMTMVVRFVVMLMAMPDMLTMVMARVTMLLRCFDRLGVEPFLHARRLGRRIVEATIDDRLWRRFAFGRVKL